MVILYIDLVTYFLTHNDPVSDLIEIFVEEIILSKFKVNKAGKVASRVFTMIWSCDQLFDPTWPSFQLVRDFAKDISLSKFEVDWAENVASSMCTMLFYDLI